LFQQKNMLHSIIEGSPGAIFAKDTRGEYKSMNETGARMLGRKVAEVIGHTDYELVPAETADAFRSTDELVMSSGRETEREVTAVIDGRTRSFLTRKAPWRNSSGEVIGMGAVLSLPQSGGVS
jgi:PAS domain S-box-containing protein